MHYYDFIISSVCLSDVGAVLGYLVELEGLVWSLVLAMSGNYAVIPVITQEQLLLSISVRF